MVRYHRNFVIVFLALIAIVVAFAPVARAGGTGIVAQIAEPFEVAGALYDAGSLRIRELKAYSPTTTLNEVRVDGAHVGLVLAASTRDVRDHARNELVFARSPRGHLVLVAFAMNGESLRELHSLGATSDSGLQIALAGSTPWLVADRRP